MMELGKDKKQIFIDLRQCADLKCSECGGVYFSILYRIKVISELLSPTGQEEYFPVKVLVCAKCGKVIDIFDMEKVLDG